ncbi:hypothetical protein AUJ46_02290 [Candidatus Peregrinibacteria bacterium CG1_02_54_53]|nr:MAG: hypothetical protein AUJ46_02290 [Candidatus Peregrinibacteria bacterium CG1_02_54_53]
MNMSNDDDDLLHRLESFVEKLPSSDASLMVRELFETEVRLFCSMLQENMGMPDHLKELFEKVLNHNYQHPGMVRAIPFEANPLGGVDYNESLDLAEAWKHKRAGLTERIFPSLRQHIIYARDQNERLRSTAVATEMTPRNTLTVNGVTVDFDFQKVSHPECGTFIFTTGKTPWKIVRLCAQDEPDGKGIASLESLGIAKSDIFKKLELVNKHFSKPIVYYKDEFVYLNPQFRE